MSGLHGKPVYVKWKRLKCALLSETAPDPNIPRAARRLTALLHRATKPLGQTHTQKHTQNGQHATFLNWHPGSNWVLKNKTYLKTGVGGKNDGRQWKRPVQKLEQVDEGKRGAHGSGGSLTGARLHMCSNPGDSVSFLMPSHLWNLFTHDTYFQLYFSPFESCFTNLSSLHCVASCLFSVRSLISPSAIWFLSVCYNKCVPLHSC